MNPRRDGQPTEAEKARMKAEHDLRKIQAETPAYRALHERLRMIRTVNHIGESLDVLFRGGRA